MSETLSFDVEELPAPVCDYCSSRILHDEKACVALDNGVCAP